MGGKKAISAGLKQGSGQKVGENRVNTFLTKTCLKATFMESCRASPPGLIRLWPRSEGTATNGWQKSDLRGVKTGQRPESGGKSGQHLLNKDLPESDLHGILPSIAA